jgi:hypothetical protein
MDALYPSVRDRTNTVTAIPIESHSGSVERDLCCRLWSSLLILTINGQLALTSKSITTHDGIEATSQQFCC